MGNEYAGRNVTVRERLLFLRQFLASPRYLGSITPSSRFLVDRLLDLADFSQATEVAELGPGTGPFTAGLLARLSPASRILSLERDAELAAHLRARFPDPRLVAVTADAQDLARELVQHGFSMRVPVIVSGLPFTSIPEPVRERILDAIVTSLAPDGCFLLYQYSTLMRGHLTSHFRTVETYWEVRNIPPAVCIRCKV